MPHPLYIFLSNSPFLCLLTNRVLIITWYRVTPWSDPMEWPRDRTQRETLSRAFRRMPINKTPIYRSYDHFRSIRSHLSSPNFCFPTHAKFLCENISKYIFKSRLGFEFFLIWRKKKRKKYCATWWCNIFYRPSKFNWSAIINFYLHWVILLVVGPLGARWYIFERPPLR